MQAVVLRAYGSNDALKLEERPQPAPALGEVLIEVHAAGINPLDFKIRAGKLRVIRDYPLPIIIGNELAGRVAAVGSGVQRFAVGDEVYARVDKDKLGAFAEYAAIDQAFVAKKPCTLDFTHAAGIPLAALTAWQALHEVLKIKRGDRIFIPAGAGGVGTLAIQIAAMAGARVTTTASGAGLDLVRKLGAEQVLDYKKSDAYAGLSGFDGAFDLVGGAELEKQLGIVAPGRTVVSIAGMPTGETARELGLGFVKGVLLNLVSRKTRGAAARNGVRYAYMFMRPDGAQLAQIAEAIDAGKITGIVDRVFPLAAFADALAYSEAGHAKGKIILKVR